MPSSSRLFQWCDALKGLPLAKQCPFKHQPKSAITRWFVQRTAGQSRRMRRIMIVAVARKLAIALWRFLEQGLVPQGAILANR